MTITHHAKNEEDLKLEKKKKRPLKVASIKITEIVRIT